MRRIVSAILVICFVFCVVPIGSGMAENRDAYHTVRIKLISLGSIKSVAATLTGNYTISQIGVELSDATVTVEVKADKIAVILNGKEIYIGNQVSFCREHVYIDGSSVQLSNDRKYLGDMHFYIENGNLVVVNSLPLAYYLYGVLAAEMNNSYPLEALKAQAVAAKCYAIKKMRNTGMYDLRDTSVDQAYKGFNSSWTRIVEAVNSTIQDVVTYNNSIIFTYYSSTNGGETNTPRLQWNSDEALNKGYAVSIDNYDFNNTSSLMEKVDVTLGTSTNNKALNDMLLNLYEKISGKQPSQLISINSIDFNSPKHEGLTRNMTRASFDITLLVEGESVDAELDFPTDTLLTSNVFSKTSLCVYWGQMTSANTYSMYHVRWGHGVGLSQRGAQARALDGHTFKQILAFYYPDAKLSTMDVSIPQEDQTVPDPTSVPSPTPNLNDVPDAFYYDANATVHSKSKTDAMTTSDNETRRVATPNAPIGLKAVAYGRVSSSTLNLRSGPGTNYPVVTTLVKNTEIVILDMSDKTWYRVWVGKMFGYVNCNYIDIVDRPTSETTYQNATINATGVNFRTGPSTGSESICKLPCDTAIYVWGTAGVGNDWYYVQYGLGYGYVYAPYIDFGDTCLYTYTSGVVAYGTTTSSASLRAYPSINAEVLNVLESSTDISIYGLYDGWYSASVNGISGYVVNRLVELESALPIAPSMRTFELPEPIGSALINEADVKFRAQPSTSAEIIAVLPKATQVLIYKNLGDWYAVVYNGNYGYVYAQYANATFFEHTDPTGVSLPVGKCSVNTLNFRSAPSTSASILGKFSKNQEFGVIGECDDWYFILYNGISGYVIKEYTSILKNDYEIIEVPASWQRVNAATSDSVNLRMGPSSAYSIITKIEKGTVVAVLAVNPDGWCLVEYQNTLGFASLRYLTIG